MVPAVIDVLKDASEEPRIDIVYIVNPHTAFETANNVRGLQVRKKELERIGSSMREIQHSTTGGGGGD